MSTVTLTEFLLARIAEDQATAAEVKLAGALHPGYSWRTITWFHQANRDHGMRWDPDRVLVECEAKRQIIAAVQESWDWDLVKDGAWEDVLRPLAMPYADHPDYLEGWRA